MTTLVLELGPDADDLQKKVRELAAELLVKNQQLLDANCEIDRLLRQLQAERARSTQNANLAPELLASLEALIQDADADHWSNDDSSHRFVTVARIERARAVISKARGNASAR